MSVVTVVKTEHRGSGIPDASNDPFSPALIALDGIDAFVDGGPMTGKRAKGGAFRAVTERVTMGVVGTALLNAAESNRAIMETSDFEQHPIAGATELGPGVTYPGDFDLVTADDRSRPAGEAIRNIPGKG
jgi:uncharacterized protein (DUF362 family)